MDVELSDFDNSALLQALIDAKWISEDEAEAITSRAAERKKIDKSIIAREGVAFGDELERAQRCIRRGNRDEALIYIERYLGREWIGELH